jgi:hypothetical protein
MEDLQGNTNLMMDVFQKNLLHALRLADVPHVSPQLVDHKGQHSHEKQQEREDILHHHHHK